jgi:hypothetical protein
MKKAVFIRKYIILYNYIKKKKKNKNDPLIYLLNLENKIWIVSQESIRNKIIWKKQK